MKRPQWRGKRHAYEQLQLKQTHRMRIHYVSAGPVSDIHRDTILEDVGRQIANAIGLTPEMMEEGENLSIGEMKERLNRIGFDFK